MSQRVVALRFMAVAFVAFLIAWITGDRYRDVLAGMVSTVLELCGYTFVVQRIDLLAPYDLALFTALVASTPVDSRRRLRALGIGLAGLVISELVIGTGMTIGVLEASVGRPWPPSATRAAVMCSGMFPWLFSGLLWLWLLGGRFFARSLFSRSMPRRYASLARHR